MRLARNFTLDELACKCGCETNASDIDSNFIYQLQKLREAFGLPIYINSGYRCPEHNKAIGGSKNSQHMFGKAADLDLTRYNAADKYRLMQLVFRLGTFRGVGIESSFVHVDTRSGNIPVFWTY